MRVCDLKDDKVYVGMRIRSLVDYDKIGTVVKINYDDDDFTWVTWDGEDAPRSGFYGTDCECEIVDYIVP